MPRIENAANREAFSNPARTVTQLTKYYNSMEFSYLEVWNGACHFGYTEEGEPFELNSAQLAMEEQLGRALDLPSGSTVLDAGAGYLRVATTMAQQFGLNILALDLIGKRLEKGKRYAKEHGVEEKIELIQGNYCNMKKQIPDSSIDGVYTMEALVHADPLDKALSEFRRVLKPGGKLVLFEYSIPPHESLDPIRQKITDTMINKTGMASIKHFTHDAFPRILQNAGFENIVVRDISRNVWPTWRWAFWRNLRQNNIYLLPKILSGKITKDTNLIASLLIYPYRHQLGYNIATATKPKDQA